MRLPFTLSFYIVRQFLQSTLMILGVFVGLIILIDSAEVLRRSYNKDISFLIMMEMVLLKFPSLVQKLTPFIMLVSAVITLSRLTRNQELIIARAAGVSVWQFLAPVVCTAAAIGVFMVTVFNPLACVMLSKNERLEGKYLKGQISSLAVSSSGLWLRQKNNSGTPNGDTGESIIHALRAGQNDGELHDVTIFVFAGKDQFVQRIDASRAKLANDFWQLHNVIITYPDKPAQRVPEFFLETELTLAQIHDSFSPPETISFWALPAFIETLKEAGFSALRHRLHWHSILVSPLFYAAMVLVAAIFSMRPQRQGKHALMITLSVFTAFLIYFFNDLIGALGLSGKLPIIVAAWVPVCAVLLASVATLLHLEDG